MLSLNWHLKWYFSCTRATIAVAAAPPLPADFFEVDGNSLREGSIDDGCPVSIPWLGDAAGIFFSESCRFNPSSSVSVEFSTDIVGDQTESQSTSSCVVGVL